MMPLKLSTPSWAKSVITNKAKTVVNKVFIISLLYGLMNKDNLNIAVKAPFLSGNFNSPPEILDLAFSKNNYVPIFFILK